MTNPTPTRRRKTSPADDVVDTAVIERFRQIARESRDHMILSDGPVHPDADLLDLCSEALHLLSTARRGRDAVGDFPGHGHDKRREADAWRKANHEAFEEATKLVGRAKPLLRRAAKIPARTGAGVFAKAQLVRNSKTGAAVLAKTLAADLVAIPGLRASLWPAGDGGAA